MSDEKKPPLSDRLAAIVASAKTPEALEDALAMLERMAQGSTLPAELLLIAEEMRKGASLIAAKNPTRAADIMLIASRIEALVTTSKAPS